MDFFLLRRAQSVLVPSELFSMSSAVRISVGLALHRTKNDVIGGAGFPEVVTSLPEAEVTCQGSRAWILQAKSMQLVFFEFQEGGKVMGHSHNYSQWGMVIDGAMELSVDGKPHVYGKGDEYLIPPGAIHNARFPCKTRLMDLFCEKERYKPKKV